MNPLLELSLLSRKWGIMLAAGVPVVQSMRILENEASPTYGTVLKEMREQITAGAGSLVPLMEARNDLFPSFYGTIIGQGEHLGNLDSMLQYAADLLESLARGGRREIGGLAKLDVVVALTLFTRQFATLLGYGIWFGRCLYILRHEAPPPFADVARELQVVPETPTGWAPLSERMARMPDIFSPFYIAMVRAGEENGSVHDEVMKYLADLLDEELRFALRMEAEGATISPILAAGRMVGWRDEQSRFIVMRGRPMPTDWRDLSENQRRLVVLLFCRSLSMLLSSGASIGKGLAAAAELLPDAQRDAVKELAETDLTSGASKPLLQLGFLPECVIAMMRSGEVGNRVDFNLNQAADAYRAELEALLA
jgi:type II secretory pathway component PulF